MTSTIATAALLLAACWWGLADEPARQKADLLFSESFDDDRLLERGWYDGTKFRIVREGSRAGGGCIEYHWKPGTTSPVTSSGIRHLFEPTDTVYVRFYLKFSKGWGWTGRSYHPHLMHFLTTENEKYAGPAATHLTLYVEPQEGRLRLAAQDIQNMDAPHGLTQGPLRGGYNGRFFDSQDVLFTDDAWHCVEAMFKLNSLDLAHDKPNADGIVRGWFDGKLVIDRTDVVLRSTDFPKMKFNQYLLTPYFGPGLLPHEQTLWIDELAVATKRLGTLPPRAGPGESRCAVSAERTRDALCKDSFNPQPQATFAQDTGSAIHNSLAFGCGLNDFEFQSASHATDESPAELRPWLGPQEWKRDADGPILSLGKSGEFDDTHIFAPTVARDGGRFRMWYCGSQGFAHDLAPTRTRDERVFRLGLAESDDGVHFERHVGPVLELATPKLSIVTPTILRDARGNVIREDGKMRMWFTSATLGGGGPPHAIQQAVSLDGVKWTDVSPIQISRAYCPTVVKTPHGYTMWYTEPGRYPWVIRHATSPDGHTWSVTEQPVLTISQPWEHDLQIYPCVLHIDGVYLMWYASYLEKNHETTAIGFAASTDGITWHKHPQNPILRPDPARPWESHYVSSHSVMQLDDGRFRIWYASRKAPPFQNLYFAINTAVWNGR